MLRKRCIGLVVLAILATPLALVQVGLPGCVTGGGAGVLFNLPPTPIITADVVRGVVPLSVRFSSDASTDDGLIVARFWDFGDGHTSQDISPSHTFTSTGDFTVTLTLTDEQGAQGAQSLIISVTEAPVARIVVDTRSAESAPAIINFDGSGSFDLDGEIVEYQWDFGDGSREFLIAVPHTYASAGTYHAKLTVTDDKGVTGSDEVTISIGIREPEIEVRVPPPEVPNVVVSTDSPLWIGAIFEVEAGVPYTIRAGLDGDRDFCWAQTVVFDANSGSTLLTITGHDDAVNAAAFSPDGTRILTASEDGTMRLHNTVTGVLEQEYTGSAAITSVAFAPDGASFVYGQADGGVVVRELADGALVRQFVGHAASVNGVDFSPNGDQILSGGNDRHAIVWNLSDGSVLRDFLLDLAVRAVTFSGADPALVATASADNTARVWNVTSGAEVVSLNGHTDVVTDVAFGPDGSVLLSGSADGTARVWTLAGELMETFTNGDGVGIASVAFSPDGLLAVTGGDDGVGRVWDLVTGQEQYTLEPLAVYEEPGGHLAQSTQTCTSPISAVAFTPDGLSILAAVAAKNDIRLDTDPPNGNDLNVVIPAALSLKQVAALDGQDVAPGQYYLWAEVRTDRTPPQRDYAAAVVNVIDPFTDEINTSTPAIPFVNDQAAIVVAPTTDRQIFDLGPLSRGDRVFLSLLSTPAYGQTYDADGFSVMVLDADQSVFTWYQEGYVLFTPDTKLVVGHNSSHYYVVVDSGHGVNVGLQRDFGLVRRQQRIYLNFAGGVGIGFGGDVPPTTFPPFDASDLDPSFDDDDTLVIKSGILQFARDRYAPWNVVITSSDEGDPPEPPYQTVHFGGSSLFVYGVADYIDPRNDTLTGSAIVYTDNFAGSWSTPQEYAAVIGEVAVHESGHLAGLRHVDNVQDIMATADWTGLSDFTVSPLSAFEQLNSPAIGIQDAPQWFDEIFGPAP